MNDPIYYFNFYAIPVGISSILVLAVGIVVFSRNIRSTVNFFFLLSCLSVFLWLSGFSIVYLCKDADVALTWYKYYSHLGVATIAPNLYLFVRALTKSLKNQKLLVVSIYFLAFIFYLLGFNPHFITGAERYFWGWYPLHGIITYPFLAFFFGLMLLSFHDLWLKRGKMGSAIENKRIKIVLIAVLLGYTAALDFLPTRKIGLYPFGYLNIFVWISLMGYAVVKYKLMMLTPAVVADQIISIIPDFLILVNKENKIIMVNRAVEESLGYKKEELINESIELIIPQEYTIKLLSNYLDKRGVIGNFEINYQTKSGKRIPVLFSGAAIHDKPGDIVGFMFTALDITERKKIEEDREKLIIELKERHELLKSQKQDAEDARIAMKKVVEDLMVSREKLKNTQDQLIQSEKLNAIGQLASGVAHEVRNPLAIILQGINYLERRVSTKDEDVFGTIALLKDSIKRADKIINALLDFSKPTSLDLNPEDVNSILDTSMSLLKVRFKFNNINFIVGKNSDIPNVLVDKNKLEQVFINILLNAVQAMPDGGKITIRSYYKELEEIKNSIGKGIGDYLISEEKAVIIEFEDTGIGIPEEHMKKIFDPFFTTKSTHGGTGLGLSLSQNILHMQNGLIYVESQVGKGTKITIALKKA